MTRREEMRVSPQDVLITNCKMLDLLLQRGEDRSLWEGADLTYVVVDEFPTYDGAQGTDVAMLLRRLAAATGASRPGRPLGSICPVAPAARVGRARGSGVRSGQAAGFFRGLTDAQLSELGVAEPLLPVIRTLTTEDQLLGLVADGSGGWLRYRYRYQHIVVDEAQDLRPAHWKMLRAMAPREADDLFLAGDTHQRIYKNQVTLGSLGVNIRGRASKLSLSYRTTRQILRSALDVLGETDYDDRDGDKETLAGYRSVLSGRQPSGHSYMTGAAEREGIAALIAGWDADPDLAIPHEQIAICVPTNQMAAEIGYTLGTHGIRPVETHAGGPQGDGGVHIGTMSRFKGLEYRRIIIAGVSDGLCSARR